jgi:hypothetical protein
VLLLDRQARNDEFNNYHTGVNAVARNAVGELWNFKETVSVVDT